MMTRLLLCATICAVTCAATNGADVPGHTEQMSLPRNPDWASDLRKSETIDLPDGRRLRLHLFLGSVVDFVGPTAAAGPARQVRPVDAIIMSTNKDLDFDSDTR